jgi:drug/metabolite transporter (DMT)-like permease
MSKRANTLAWLCYATVSLVWGSTFLSIAWAVRSFTPWGLSAARFLPAGLLALGLGRLRREPWPGWRELPHVLLVGLLLLGVVMGIIAWAELRVASGLVACTAAMVPLYLALLEPMGLDGRKVCGLLLGIAGVAALLLKGLEPGMLPPAAALVGSAFLWAYGTFHSKRHAGRCGHFTQVGLEMLTAGLLALGLACRAGGFLHAPLGAGALAALAYLVLFGSILAYSAFIHLAKVWPAARVGTYAYLNPVVGLALGWSLGREPFHAQALPGLGLILLGVALVQVPRPAVTGRGRDRRSPGRQERANPLLVLGVAPGRSSGNPEVELEPGPPVAAHLLGPGDDLLRAHDQGSAGSQPPGLHHRTGQAPS